MDFTTAIQAHSDWKLKLFTACDEGSHIRVDIATLMKDDACELGKWLHGPAGRYAADPKFQELLVAHADFHKAAASLARMIDLGKKADAEALLNARDSDFNRLSRQVVAVLMEFRRRNGNG